MEEQNSTIDLKAKVKMDEPKAKGKTEPKAKAEVETEDSSFEKPAKGFARVFTKIRYKGKPAQSYVDVPLDFKTENGDLLIDIYKRKLAEYQKYNGRRGKVCKIING